VNSVTSNCQIKFDSVKKEKREERKKREKREEKEKGERKGREGEGSASPFRKFLDPPLHIAVYRFCTTRY